jgi:hypothetical protein
MMRKIESGYGTGGGIRYGGKDGLRKIGEAKMPCIHPEHNPPTHIVLEPGLYEYECPGCGRKITFSVPAIMMCV